MNTDFILLDDDFSVCGMPENCFYLMRHRKFFDVGKFKLVIPTGRADSFDNARFVYFPQNDEIWLIDTVSAGKFFGRNGICIEGRSPEALLDCRVINGSEVLSGNLEDCVRALVSKYAMAGDRAIPGLALGTKKGFSYTVSAQTRGVLLGSFLRSILKPHGLSFSLSFDSAKNALVFDIPDASNRAAAESGAPIAVFSDNSGTLGSTSLEQDRKSRKNIAYVIGTGNDDKTFEVCVDKRIAGEERLEMYCEAKGIKQTYVSDSGTKVVLTDDEFRAKLTAYGERLLALSGSDDKISGVAVPEFAPEYAKDYVLGDFCMFCDDALGISSVARISEIVETIENGASNVRVVLRKDPTIATQ